MRRAILYQQNSLFLPETIKQKEAIFNSFRISRSLSYLAAVFVLSLKVPKPFGFHADRRFFGKNYALRTLSMWRVRSSILQEKPHSLSYHAMSFTKLSLRAQSVDTSRQHGIFERLCFVDFSGWICS